MIKFDFTNIRQEVIGSDHGLDVDFEFANYSQKISQIIKHIFEQKDNPDSKYRWMNCYNEKQSIDEVLEYADMVKGKFENIITLGCGGPIFGIQALTQALLMPYWNTLSNEERNNYLRLDILNNIEPDEINGFATARNLKKSLILTISKKGLVPEVMSIFMIAKRRMEYELGENYRMHMITCCSRQDSVLSQISNQEGYKSFDIPDYISGRFSVLSAVGLLPLALVGIDIQEVLQGAKTAIEKMRNPNIYENETAKIALIQYLLNVHKNKNISIVMPYSSRLKALPFWCSQLKAETLSQQYDLDGKDVSLGHIPYSSYGCTDHHTIFQMFHQGLNNKLVNFIKVDTFDTDNVIPEFYDYTAVGYLGGKTLSELMNVEMNAAKMLLVDNQRPNLTMTLPRISPYYMGQFLALYMGSMVIQAHLYNLDPYAEPGIDNLYNYIYAQLGKYGYEATYQEMQDKLQRCKFTP